MLQLVVVPFKAEISKKNNNILLCLCQATFVFSEEFLGKQKEWEKQ